MWCPAAAHKFHLAETAGRAAEESVKILSSSFGVGPWNGENCGIFHSLFPIFSLYLNFSPTSNHPNICSTLLRDSVLELVFEDLAWEARSSSPS